MRVADGRHLDLEKIIGHALFTHQHYPPTLGRTAIAACSGLPDLSISSTSNAYGISSFGELRLFEHILDGIHLRNFRLNMAIGFPKSIETTIFAGSTHHYLEVIIDLIAPSFNPLSREVHRITWHILSFSNSNASPDPIRFVCQQVID